MKKPTKADLSSINARLETLLAQKEEHRPIVIDVPLKPYVCAGLIFTQVECPSCKNNGGIWIEVKEFPLIAFCPTHWRPIAKSSAVADLKEALGVS